MILLLSICFLLVIAALYLSTNSAAIQAGQSRYDAVAQQMVYYHVAASKVCALSCADGDVVDPTSQLASFRQNQGAFAPGTSFRSVAQGDYIITYYINPDEAAERVQANGGVLAALTSHRDFDTQTWVGSYNATTASLNLRSNSYWIDPETGTKYQTVIEQPDIAPLPASDGAPILINRR